MGIITMYNSKNIFTETLFILAPILCRDSYFILCNRFSSIRISSLDSDALRKYISWFKKLRIFCSFIAQITDAVFCIATKKLTILDNYRQLCCRHCIPHNMKQINR